MNPFCNQKSDTVAALGEERLIVSIRRWLGDVSPPAPLGIGDDCAVLPPSKRSQAITVDPVIYGRHFDDSIPPKAVGEKLLKRNLSDLAAMGARPRFAVVALTLDPSTRTAWLEKFYRGLAACARRYRLAIVGGDIAQANGVLAASLTLIGEASGRRMLTRAGARIGDRIYVTGPLGGSLLGKHVRFCPLLDEGAWLASRPEVNTMMDMSDGLAKDLHELTPAGGEAALDASRIPISSAARRIARQSGRTALAHALSDGEDYELLFTVRRRADHIALERQWLRRFGRPLHALGHFVPEGKLPAGAIDLRAYHGYEHLR